MTARSNGALPALVLLAVIWGYNWVVMKVALTFCGPFTFGMLRMGIGAAALAAGLLGMRRSLRLTAPGPVALLGLLQTTAFIAFSNLAVAGGGAGKSAVLVYTMPFWALLLAWPFLHERPRGLQWFAALAGLIGLLLVLYPLDLGAGFRSELYAVACGFCWGASVVYAKRLRARIDFELGALTFWQMIFGTLPLVAFALIAREPPPQWTFAFNLALLYNTVLGTALGWMLWLHIVNKLPAGVAGVAALAAPVIGVLSAWAQLHEVPSATELAGITCIVAALAGLVLQSRTDARVAPRAALASSDA